MNQSNPLVAPLRVLAAIFSVGVGGYLVWAAQLSQRGEPESPTTEEPHTQSTPSDEPDHGVDHSEGADVVDSTPVFLPSSKNQFQGGHFFPPLQPEATVEADSSAAPFLSSSKRMVMPGEVPRIRIVEEVPGTERMTEAELQAWLLENAEEAERDPTFWYSSKSAPLHLVDPEDSGSPEAEPDSQKIDQDTQPE